MGVFNIWYKLTNAIMGRLIKIDDVIDYLNVMKKHGQYISEACIDTPARFDFDKVDIRTSIPDVKLENWAKDHAEFFKSDESTNECCR